MKTNEHFATGVWDSVEHWFDLYQIAEYAPRCISKEDISSIHCPSCIAAGGGDHEHAGDPDCYVCPIAKFSGHPSCAGTPWVNVNAFLRRRGERLARGEKLHELVLYECAFLLDVAFDMELTREDP